MGKVKVGHTNITSQNLPLNTLRLVPHMQNNIIYVVPHCWSCSGYLWVFLNKPEKEEFWKAFKPRCPTSRYLAQIFLPPLPFSTVQYMPILSKREHCFFFFLFNPDRIVRDSALPWVLYYMMERSAPIPHADTLNYL